MANTIQCEHLEKGEAVGKVPEVAEERRLGSALHLRPLECLHQKTRSGPNKGTSVSLLRGNLTTITAATLQAHLRLWIWKGDLYLEEVNCENGLKWKGEHQPFHRHKIYGLPLQLNVWTAASNQLPSLASLFHLKADNADHIYLDTEQVQIA